MEQYLKEEKEREKEAEENSVMTEAADADEAWKVQQKFAMSGKYDNIYLTRGKKNFPIRQTDSQSKFLSLFLALARH